MSNSAAMSSPCTRSICDSTASLRPAVSSVISPSVAAGVSSCGTWKKTKSSSFGNATISFDEASGLSGEKITHRLAGGLEHAIELFPAVDLLDLRVAIEVEVEDDELAAVLHGFS